MIRKQSTLPLCPDAPSHESLSAGSQTPIEKPATAKNPAPTQKPAPTEKLAPTKKPAPTEKPAPTKTPSPTKATAVPTNNLAPTQSSCTPPKSHSILFDASKFPSTSLFPLAPKKAPTNKLPPDIPKAKPNQPEIEHLKFIQTLHRDGHSKDDITDCALATYPDLCKGQGPGTEEARKAIVLSNVEIYTSRWAESYI